MMKYAVCYYDRDLKETRAVWQINEEKARKVAEAVAKQNPDMAVRICKVFAIIEVKTHFELAVEEFPQ